MDWQLLQQIMTHCKRILARLDIKGNRLIKGLRFEGLRVIGDPLEAALAYSNSGADEILFVDAVASLYGRNSLSQILKSTSQNIFIPVTAGGGIRSIEDASALLSAGADKILINTAAITRPELIYELSQSFGSQCIVVSIQARRFSNNYWEAMCESGRQRSGIDVFSWIDQVQNLGVGEILLTSVDQDGTCSGPDNDLNFIASNHVHVPLVVGGGFFDPLDINSSLNTPNISGVSIGAALHRNLLSIDSCKENLSSSNFSIRTNISHSHSYSRSSHLKIGIVNYGMGNQQSLINALQYIGYSVLLSDNTALLSSCDLLMLPGVGSFPQGMSRLKEFDFINFLSDWVSNGHPLIGICLGMQMLFSYGTEFGFTPGLSFIPGDIKILFSSRSSSSSPDFPLPHIGWNKIESLDPSFSSDECFYYFVHSYAPVNVSSEHVIAYSTYGSCSFPSIVRNKSVGGFQFHPERSGSAGLLLLSNMIEDFVAHV